MEASLCEDNSTKAVSASLAEFSAGKLVIILDGRDEHTQCSLALSAEHATDKNVAFMIRHSAGIVNAVLDQQRLEGFGLHPATMPGGKAVGSQYVSTNFLPGTTTGISAKDRAATLTALCDTSNPAAAFGKPGHIFPLCAAKDGVLECGRHAEACFDLCRESGVAPVGVLAELMHEDGTMYSRQDAYNFSKQHQILVVTVEQMIDRRKGASPLTDPSRIALETESLMYVDDIEAECILRVYRTSNPKVEIVTIAKGDLKGAESVPARLHSECFTGDILGSKRCDCGQQLHKFMKIMNEEKCGVLMYVRGHEGRGIGLANKIRAYRLQDEGHDTLDANLKLGLPVDSRSYEDALAVFIDLGLKSIRLFTNNPEKMKALLPITKGVSALASIPCKQNEKYLKTKRERMNHQTILSTFKLPTPVAEVKSKLKIGVVYTTWNKYYVDELLQGAVNELDSAGVRHLKMSVPGAADLITGARCMLRKHKPDAVIVLGVLIRGSSDLYEATCNGLMTGLASLNASQDTPITVGLLMCHDEQQAQERSHGAYNPAKAWAETAMHMASINCFDEADDSTRV